MFINLTSLILITLIIIKIILFNHLLDPNEGQNYAA